MPSSILLALSDEGTRKIASGALRQDGYEVSFVPQDETIFNELLRGRFDIVLCDLHQSDLSMVRFLRKIESFGNEAELVLVVPDPERDRGILAMKEGASAFLPDPFDMEHLRVVVARALERRRMRQDAIQLRNQLGHQFSPARIIGSSSRILSLRRSIHRLARANDPVLLVGERGTGKSVVARVLHHTGGRSGGPFVTFPCEAFPPSTVLDHLVGVAPRGRPGVSRHRPGWLERAHGGTLFFEDISRLEMGHQETILRAIDTGEVLPVGAARPIRTQVRILASLHQLPQVAVANRHLHPDLYARLRPETLEVPPLRNHREDIPSIVHFILHGSGATDLVVDRNALDWLMEQNWTGNVLELESVVQRALLFRRSADRLDLEDFAGAWGERFPAVEVEREVEVVRDGELADESGRESEAPGEHVSERENDAPGEPETAGKIERDLASDEDRESGPRVAPEARDGNEGEYHAGSGYGERNDATASIASSEIHLPSGGVDLVTLERKLIEEALSRTEGNQTRAARLLGLSRQTLIYRMQKYGIR